MRTLKLASASLVARKLGAIGKTFKRARARLPRVDAPQGPGPAYELADVLALVEETGEQLSTEMHKHGYPAMASYFAELVRRAREDLAPPANRVGAGRSAAVRHAVRRSAAAPPHRAASGTGPRLVAIDRADRQLDMIRDGIDRGRTLAKKDRLSLELCLESEPEDGVRVWLYPVYSYPNEETSGLTNNRVPIERGSYVYRARKEARGEINCLPDAPRRGALCARLDLVSYERPLVRCHLVEAADASAAIDCEVVEEPGRRACKGG